MMLRRPQWIGLALVLALTVTLLALPREATARLKLGLGSLFVPLFGLANSSRQAARNAAEAVLPRSALISENRALKLENEQLRLQVMRAEEVARENARLRQLFAWRQTTPWKLKLAGVVLRDPSNWWRTIQIDLGSRDGIAPNLPVLTTSGLVGRVGAVGLTRSQVVLLGDPSCRVSALVENETRDTGVISAGGPLDSSLVELAYLSRNADLKPGQNVVTSGLGGIFPKGIPIGRLVDAHSAEYGLYTVGRVRLAANLSALEEVWVMLAP